jgi:pimeloyl-ACP methyl ester carboxylesterase
LIRICFALILILASCAVRAYEKVDIPSVHGVPTRVLIAPTQAAKATVLLFIGGGGLVKIADDGRTNHIHTFVRSLGMWRAYELQAVLIDSPIDLGNALRGHQRASKEHLDRVSEVVRHFHSNSSQPIWIFGHSMGTSTVAAFLSSNRPEVSLLKGYIVAGTHRGESVPASIKLPVLGIHHSGRLVRRRQSRPPKPSSNRGLRIPRGQWFCWTAEMTKAIAVRPWPITASMGSSRI